MRTTELLRVLVAAALPCCATTGSPGGTSEATASAITVHNRSGFGVFHLYLSPVQRAAWGDDRLGREAFHDGSTIALRGVSCGHYDIRLVDEDGDECILRNQDLCHEHGGLTLNSQEVASCQGWAPTATAAH